MSDWVEIEGEIKYWPMCPIKECQNRICLSLNSDYCWPHTKSGKSLDEVIGNTRSKKALPELTK